MAYIRYIRWHISYTYAYAYIMPLISDTYAIYILIHNKDGICILDVHKMACKMAYMHMCIIVCACSPLADGRGPRR